jgi:CheY-like chemotaxis protein/HPt (histidine-containing phosphotransfer) domain-containing protein
MTLSIAVTARSPESATLLIAVRDTGIGIAPENQARIFSGFTQAEASTTRRFGGTGLGVAISQRLVALMGGELGLESALGQGSRFFFSICLPVATEEPASGAAPAAPMRALVVDDNPHAREVLERMALSLGWAVDTAESGERGLELMRDRTLAGCAYEAVFVDWQMPGLDGWETIRRMRAGGLQDSAPAVVMVTAHDREMLSSRSPEDQALLDGFLVKPVTASMLLDAVIDARCAKDQSHPSRPHVAVSRQRLTGVRLLVAEDNLNNQQVARELLEGEGAIVQIAGNGQQAVDAICVSATSFDVVLMDLQMPVMDGLTATHRIRTELQLTQLPIVAMTANAMASDREECLAAGMNDHVGKPFDLDHLVRVIRRYVPRGEAPEALPKSVSDAPAAAPALADGTAGAAAAAGVGIDTALKRIGGNTSLYLRMMRMFVKDLESMPAQLSGLVESGDLKSATRLLHTLKGTAATLGVSALSTEAARGEALMAAGATPAECAAAARQAGNAMTAAGPRLEALLAALESTIRPAMQPAAVRAAPLDRGAALSDLRALAGQLADADMEATNTVLGLQDRFGATLGDPFRRLDAAVGALDFETAARLCSELIAGLGSDVAEPLAEEPA